MSQSKSFFDTLLDLKFESFLTLRFISVLYIFFLVVAGLGCVVFAFSGFANSFASGLGTLIIAPVVLLIYVVTARIWLELVVVAFRIAENTGKMVEQLSGTNSSAAETKVD